jgi:hypothetical protein
MKGVDYMYYNSKVYRTYIDWTTGVIRQKFENNPTVEFRIPFDYMVPDKVIRKIFMEKDKKRKRLKRNEYMVNESCIGDLEWWLVIRTNNVNKVRHLIHEMYRYYEKEELLDIFDEIRMVVF